MTAENVQFKLPRALGLVAPRAPEAGCESPVGRRRADAGSAFTDRAPPFGSNAPVAHGRLHRSPRRRARGFRRALRHRRASPSCKGIAEGVENCNYLLHTEPGSYILTLYEKRVARADLPFFLGLMDHLAARGIACPTPIHGRDGEALRELCGRPAAIISFLDGMWPRRPTPRHCQLLGEALARHAPGRRRLRVQPAERPVARRLARCSAGLRRGAPTR